MKKLILIFIFLLCGGQAWAQGESVSHRIKIDSEEYMEGVKSRCLCVEVGDSMAMEYSPSFSLSAWGNEIWARVHLRTAFTPLIDAIPTVLIRNGEPFVTLTDGNYKYEMFLRKDGNFEWAIIINSNPDTNVFSFPIETEGLDFHYQPELTPEEIAEGAYRPDSVVGSYAVYHSTKADNRRIISGKDTTYEVYRCGKAFHIFRPKVHDDKDTVWCDLSIDTKKGKLNLTIPDEFLEYARYPITIDPQFGNTDSGGTSSSPGFAYCYTVRVPVPAGNGTADSVVAVLGDGGNADNFEVAIYDHDAGNNYAENLLDSGYMETPNDDSHAWRQIALVDNDVTITASTIYWLGFRTNTYWYDANGGDHKYSYVSNATWPDPWGDDYSSATSKIISIYCVYSEEAPAAVKLLPIRK